jgi:hypothetical protein
MNGLHSRNTDTNCFFNYSGSHIWSNAVHVELSDGLYSEVICLNSGCGQIERIFIK